MNNDIISIEQAMNHFKNNYANSRNMLFAKAALQAVKENKVVVELYNERPEENYYRNMYADPLQEKGSREFEVEMPLFIVVEEEYAVFPNAIIHKVCDGLNKFDIIKKIEDEIEGLEGLV